MSALCNAICFSFQCQFCEKCFVNYSYLQSHVQRRHPEITDAGINTLSMCSLSCVKWVSQRKLLV